MKSYNRIKHLLTAAAVVAVAALMTLGCTTTADYTLGEEFAPTNQQMITNIFRSSAVMMKENDIVLPVGKRAVDYYTSRKRTVVTKEFTSCEDMTSDGCSRAAYLIRDMYDRGEIGGVRLISTEFVSMLTQNPNMTHLLPLRKEGADETKPSVSVEYEPSAEAVLAALIPEYIAGVLYSSVCESFASELAARRTAMDAATKNADEMLDNLSLKYNQARQSAITQEITEIVAGANA